VDPISNCRKFARGEELFCKAEGLISVCMQMPASLVEQHNKFFTRQEVTQLKAVVVAAAPRFGAAKSARVQICDN